MLKELSKVEQRYQAVMAVQVDGLTVTWSSPGSPDTSGVVIEIMPRAAAVPLRRS